MSLANTKRQTRYDKRAALACHGTFRKETKKKRVTNHSSAQRSNQLNSKCQQRSCSTLLLIVCLTRTDRQRQTKDANCTAPTFSEPRRGVLYSTPRHDATSTVSTPGTQHAKTNLPVKHATTQRPHAQPEKLYSSETALITSSWARRPWPAARRTHPPGNPPPPPESYPGCA